MTSFSGDSNDTNLIHNKLTASEKETKDKENKRSTKFKFNLNAKPFVANIGSSFQEDQPVSNTDLEKKGSSDGQSKSKARKRSNRNKKQINSEGAATSQNNEKDEFKNVNKEGTSQTINIELTSKDKKKRNNKRNQRNGTKKQSEDITSETKEKASSPETSHTSTSSRSNDNRKSKKIIDSNKIYKKNHRVKKVVSVGQTNGSEDIRTKLINSLTDGSYECMVCWDNIHPKNHTWSCKSCWAVFHLSCVKKWSKVGEKDESEGRNYSISWRCPGCQTTQDTLPKDYLCFCTRVSFPEVNRYLTPHSCGQTCGKSRGEGCPHPCVEPCHPGPCPPCAALAPTSYCFCGKLAYQARCTDSDANGKSCGEICGELLGCGEHECEAKCHEGACPPCKFKVIQKCYCGQSERESHCGTGFGIETYNIISEDNVILDEPSLGYFNCLKPCERYLNCGNHKCNKACHIQDQHAGECPRDPEILKTCPCGKTEISQLSSTVRKSCLDPIPVCYKKCGKKLSNCGHECQSLCHEGPCPPCEAEDKVYCRCGSISEWRICSSEEPELRCDKVCNQFKHCTKHRCTEICCEASKRGNPDSNGLHICLNICDKKLRCGNHRCQSLCHNGKCPPCLEASFEDLFCACGKTKIEAPIPCGTPPPKCKFPCIRSRPCGHTTLLEHNCHSDNVECPPCTALTNKYCRCGKKELKHIPCFRQKPSCGTPCNKTLPCGAHVCKKLCHDGPCLEEGAFCSAICRKPRPVCGHPCQAICHAPALCSPTTLCNTTITVTCDCGLLKVDKVCSGNDPKEQKASCNEKCFMDQRNKRLASAFGLDDKPVAEDPTLLYDPYVFMFITPTQLKWVKMIEEKIAEFIRDKNCPVLRFSPMRSFQRKFLHIIAPNYQVKSVSEDEPPNKSVVYTRTQQTQIPKIIPSVAYKYQDKYMKVDDDLEDNTKTPRQAINSILIKNLTMEPILNHNIEKAMSEANLRYDIFNYGNNVVVKPIHTLTDMSQAEEIIRKSFYIIKSTLISVNIIAKVNYCWVNSSNEVTWPKLEVISNKKQDQTEMEYKNTFNILNHESLSTLPPETLTEIQYSYSTRNPSPTSSIKKEVEEIDMRPNILSSDLVDDWTQLV